MRVDLNEWKKLVGDLEDLPTEAVKEAGYSDVYRKIKGNYFKGKKYVQEYIEGGKQ